MKVIVTCEAQFEVEVDTHSRELAQRAVEANWDSLYKHRARWKDGAPPNLTARLLRVEAADK